MEEIVLQSIRDAAQQGDVNVVLSENLVNMCPRAADAFGQPCGRNPMPLHDFLDMLPDVHSKSVEFLSCLNIRASTPHSSNKLFHAVPCTAFNNQFLMSMLSKESVVEGLMFKNSYKRCYCIMVLLSCFYNLLIFSLLIDVILFFFFR